MASPLQIEHPVAVIGGGWAGLATAVWLTASGMPVTLFEAARQLGGRARCVSFNGMRVDNGQHIMTGACHELLELVRLLRLEERDIFERQPLKLDMDSLTGGHFRIRPAAGLPSPLNILIGLLGARDISWMERLALLRFIGRLRANDVELDRDITAQALLISERQTSNLIRRLWAPLCLASLNTPIQDASAVLFVEVLSRTFTEDPADTELLFARTDLGSVIPTSAFEYIESHGGRVILSRRIHDIEIEPDRFQVHWRDGRLSASQVVVATHPTVSRRLLGSNRALRPTMDRLAQLEYSPICTVYLHYPQETGLRQTMRGILDGTAQWIFDRAICGQRGLMAVVISGPGPHMRMNNADLGAHIAAEIARLYPDWPAPRATQVIREKRATFHAGVDVNRLRPEQRTAVPGLWLAGDYTATGLPATLEGAVTSGRRCATHIINEAYGRTDEPA